jgi:hypothetical protein
MIDSKALRPILRRRGQVSAAKHAANRRNARRSTGPRTPAGKARSARNALRHGLTACPLDDLALMREAVALSRAILQTGTDLEKQSPERQASEDPLRRSWAMQIAIAHIRVLQVRRAKQALHGSSLEWDELTRRLASLDRYEGRALACRKIAMRRFNAAPEISQTRQNEANAGNNSAISIEWLKTPASPHGSHGRCIVQRLRQRVRRSHNGSFAAKSPRRRLRQWSSATAGAPGNDIKERLRAPRSGSTRAGSRRQHMS